MPPPMSLAEIAALPASQAAPPAPKAAPTQTESMISAMTVEDKDLFDGLLNTIQEVLAEAPPAEPVAPRPRVTSPLFADFSEADLFAVIQGLELATYGPGDILILEGDPGTSLFIVTTGTVKAFVKQKDGSNRLVREMGEGSFFGEISVLSGKPRTASVTAKTVVEALVLERRVLDEMVRTHPSVRTTLEKFAAERLQAGK
jgi:CRP-like cAMP-binding protein